MNPELPFRPRSGRTARRAARPGLVTLAVILVSLFVPSTCRAGDQAEHYDFVYAIVRAAGYSPTEAKIVAAASWSVDTNDDTSALREPLYVDVIDTKVLLDMVSSTPRYARLLRTNDAAVDDLIFKPTGLAALKGWASRYAPAMVLHALVKDPERLWVLFPQYFDAVKKALQDNGGKGKQLRAVELILLGQFLHQIVDRFVHPREPVIGHAGQNKTPELLIHRPDEYLEAAKKVLEVARSFLTEPRRGPRIDPPDTGNLLDEADRRPDKLYEKLGLNNEVKRIAFLDGLVKAGAAGYDRDRLSGRRNSFDGKETPWEVGQGKANLQDCLNRVFKKAGLPANVTIPDFQPVTYKVVGSKLKISYGNLVDGLLIDSVCFWVKRDPEMMKSMRASLREGLLKGDEIFAKQVWTGVFERLLQQDGDDPQPSTTSQGTSTGPRIGFDDSQPRSFPSQGTGVRPGARILGNALASGTPTQNATLLGVLRDILARQSTPARQTRTQQLLGETMAAWQTATDSPAKASPSSNSDTRDTGSKDPKVKTLDLGPKQQSKADVGGVRFYHDARVLSRILASGTPAQTSRLLASLERQLRSESDPAKQKDIVRAFVGDLKGRFKALKPFRKVDDLTVLSLKSLVERAERFKDRWEDLPRDLRTPGRLSRVCGFVLQPERGDILILGSSDPKEAGLELDDLIVAIRVVWLAGGTPTCSLDPDPDDAAAGRAGAQKVRLSDVPRDSGFARTMLDADYAMKKVLFGTQPVKVAGFTSLKDLLRASADLTREMGVSRVWFYPVPPGAGDIQVSSNRRVALFDTTLQVLTEQVALTREGMIGLGKVSPSWESTAGSFSKHFPAIARQQPHFRKLQGLADLVTLAHLARQMQFKSALLERLARLPYRKVRVPESYPGIKETILDREKDGTRFQFWLFGGVALDVSTGPRTWLVLDDPDLVALRKKATAARFEKGPAAALPGVSLRLPQPAGGGDGPLAALRKLAAQDVAGALADASRAIEADPYDPQALAVRALIHCQRGDLKAARIDARRARAAGPEDAAVALLIARCLCLCRLHDGDRAAALAELEVTLQGLLPTRESHFLRGTVLMALDRVAQARREFQAALTLDPTFAPAYARLALLEAGEGWTSKAKRLARRARGLNADLLEARAALALAELSLGQFRAAETLARPLLEHPASDPGVLELAARVLVAATVERNGWAGVSDLVGTSGKKLAPPARLALLLAVAESAHKAEQSRLAADCLEQLRRLAPDSPRVKSTLKKIGS